MTDRLAEIEAHLTESRESGSSSDDAATLRENCAWLIEQVRATAKDGGAPSPTMDELTALVDALAETSAQVGRSMGCSGETERDAARTALLTRLAKLTDERDNWIQGFQQQRDKLRDARSRAQRLEDALRRYGWHNDACHSHVGDPCDCGFDATAALLSPPPERTILDTPGGNHLLIEHFAAPSGEATTPATLGAPMSALDVANAFHRYARHRPECVTQDESRINVGGDASWNRCDCGLDDIRLTLDRAWKGGKMHGESVPQPTHRRDEAEGLVRLIVESFRDAPNPSVDIAVEEIMRTFDPPPASSENAGALATMARRVTDTERLDWMLKHGASVLVLADHRHSLDYQPMNRDELDDLMRREVEARAINAKLDAADKSTETTGRREDVSAESVLPLPEGE